jgi:hypothetical protein
MPSSERLFRCGAQRLADSLMVWFFLRRISELDARLRLLEAQILGAEATQPADVAENTKLHVEVTESSAPSTMGDSVEEIDLRNEELGKSCLTLHFVRRYKSPNHGPRTRCKNCRKGKHPAKTNCS